MSHSTISMIIIAIVIVLYATEKIPLSVTSILGMLAMAITGVITFPEAFAGFSNTTIFLLIGLSMIGKAFYTTGIADVIGRTVINKVGNNEKLLVIVLYCIGAALGTFLSPMVIVAIFIPVINVISAKSDGSITKKHTYMPLAIGATFGGQLTLIGTSSMVTASGILEASEFGRGIGFLEPFPVTIAGVIVPLLFYILIGYDLQKKIFDFPDVPNVEESEDLTDKHREHKRWKMVLVAVVLVFVVVGIAFDVMNMGAIALIGACILIISGCIDERTAFNGVSWTTIFVVACSLGLAKGLEVSGAGVIIAEYMIKVAGPIGSSPFGMCLLLLVISTLLTALMSDTATVAIMVPFAIEIANVLGMSPLPYVFACVRGANLGIFTPVSTASMTLITIAGYRFKDYFSIAGIVSLLAVISTAVSLYLIYF